MNFECMMCKEARPSDNRICAIIKCGHIYHTSCLKTWKDMGNQICPVCSKIFKRTVELQGANPSSDEDNVGSSVESSKINPAIEKPRTPDGRFKKPIIDEIVAAHPSNRYPMKRPSEPDVDKDDPLWEDKLRMRMKKRQMNKKKQKK